MMEKNGQLQESIEKCLRRCEKDEYGAFCDEPLKIKTCERKYERIPCVNLIEDIFLGANGKLYRRKRIDMGLSDIVDIVFIVSLLSLPTGVILYFKNSFLGMMILSIGGPLLILSLFFQKYAEQRRFRISELPTEVLAETADTLIEKINDIK